MEQKFRVLWAEDEQSLLEIMCELLTSEGIECVGARDGLEAAKILRKERFDLLIADFNMPNMNGAELLMWCRTNGLHFPVIFVTAKPERLPVENMVTEDCCTSIVNKPFSIESLLKQIEKSRERNHEFHCRGFTVPESVADFEKSFPGQHVLPD